MYTITKRLLLQLLVLCAVPFAIQAQGVEEPKATKSFVVKANNWYQFSKKPLNNYYSLGSEVGLYLNNKWYVGLAQYSSLAPSDLWKNNPYKPDIIRAYEYTVQVGYKTTLASPLYLYTGLRAGYGALHMEYRYNNGVDADETMTKEKMGGVLVSPDLKLGVKIHKYIDVEAGLNYRYHIGSKDKWGLSTNKMNGLGGVISIVGNIPL